MMTVLQKTEVHTLGVMIGNVMTGHANRAMKGRTVTVHSKRKKEVHVATAQVAATTVRSAAMAHTMGPINGEMTALREIKDRTQGVITGAMTVHADHETTGPRATGRITRRTTAPVKEGPVVEMTARSMARGQERNGDTTARLQTGTAAQNVGTARTVALSGIWSSARKESRAVMAQTAIAHLCAEMGPTKGRSGIWNSGPRENRAGRIRTATAERATSLSRTGLGPKTVR